MLEVLPREKQGLQEVEEVRRGGRRLVGGKGGRPGKSGEDEKTEVEIRVSAR